MDSGPLIPVQPMPSFAKDAPQHVATVDTSSGCCFCNTNAMALTCLSLTLCIPGVRGTKTFESAHPPPPRRSWSSAAVLHMEICIFSSPLGARTDARAPMRPDQRPHTAPCQLLCGCKTLGPRTHAVATVFGKYIGAPRTRRCPRARLRSFVHSRRPPVDPQQRGQLRCIGAAATPPANDRPPQPGTWTKPGFYCINPCGVRCRPCSTARRRLARGGRRRSRLAVRLLRCRHAPRARPQD